MSGLPRHHTDEIIERMNESCSVAGCTRTDVYKSRQLCRLHYQRWRKTGDPLGLRRGPQEPIHRFWSKVEKQADEGCWLWLGGLSRQGYGRFQAGRGRRDSRVVLAHIYAWEAQHGPVPDGLELDHTCRTRACVRPDHLEPVTHAENVRRGGWGDYVRAQAAKTHCKQGHPLSGDNLIVTSRQRRCRACKNASERARAQRRRNGPALPRGESASEIAVQEPSAG